jgi:DNA-binding transcriptional LysR family regulator
MDLRRLRYFMAVAESLHFGKAAVQVGISQPALSQQIQRLEQELGVTLLTRTSRTTALTQAGLIVLDPLRRCLASYDEAIRAARAAREEPRQAQLRLAVPSLEAGIIFEPLLRRIVRQFPDTKIELTEFSCENQPAAIRDGEADAGFVHLPMTGSDLASMVVRRDELVVLLPHNHPFAADDRIDIRKLEDEPFIEFRTQCPVYTNETKRLLRRSGFVPQIEYVSNALAGIIEMVSMRLGISIVPGSSISREPSGIIARRLDPASKPLDLAFVWRHDRTSAAIHQLHRLIDEMAHERGSTRRPTEAVVSRAA